MSLFGQFFFSMNIRIDVGFGLFCHQMHFLHLFAFCIPDIPATLGMTFSIASLSFSGGDLRHFPALQRDASKDMCPSVPWTKMSSATSLGRRGHPPKACRWSQEHWTNYMGGDAQRSFGLQQIHYVFARWRKEDEKQHEAIWRLGIRLIAVEDRHLKLLERSCNIPFPISFT